MVEILRKRFIFISAMAVATVLLVIATALNLSNYSRMADHANELVRIIVNNDGRFPKGDGQKDERGLPPKLSPEDPFSTRFFTVKLDENKTIMSVDTGKISASTHQAVDYAEQVIKRGKTDGFIDSYKFTVADKAYGALIVFVDCNRELRTFRSFLYNSIWVCLIGLAAVVALIVIVSKRAIAPLAESYEKQKQFITNAGHELKTPLAIIQTNAEVLELEQGESEWSLSIRRQVERMNGLVTSLVALTRMDEAKNSMTMLDFPLSEAVFEAAQPFESPAQSMDKTLTLHIDEGLFYHGNEESLRQLVSILLDNAVRYASAKGDIRLSLERRGKKLILQTVNPAPNLVAGDYEVLFERFYRAESSRSRQTGGYGIGLSVAKGIVEKHRGKLTAASPDGEKLIITALLP